MLQSAQIDAAVERSVVLSAAVATADEPVTVAELQAYLRDTTPLTAAYQASLEMIIAAARGEFERQTGRAIPNQTLIYRRRGFPCARDFLELPRSPARSISSITYLSDVDGSTTTLATAVYGLDATQDPARVYLKHDQSWPAVRDLPGSVVITYVAGAATAAAIAPVHKLATLWFAAWWYENRLPVNLGNTVNELPHHLSSIVAGQTIYVAYP